jgi:pantetheine-phosphate adenylyltransferase
MSPGAPAGKRIALFPASFDPLTNGHLDLIHRTEQVFDEVVVAIATNVDKSGGTFTVDERLAILREVLGDEPRVRVESFSGLVVDFAEEIGATAIIRGLRAMSDFEYEFEMALMNRHLKPGIEILFMMTSLECLYVSSSRLKELAYFGADIEEFVPPVVAKRLRDKVRRR